MSLLSPPLAPTPPFPPPLPDPRSTSTQQALVKCLREAYKWVQLNSELRKTPMSHGTVAHAMELWILIRTLHSVEEVAAARQQDRHREEVQAKGHAIQVGGGLDRGARHVPPCVAATT